MSFVRYSPAEHKIDQDDYEEVEQGDVYLRILSGGEEISNFYAEGLNPCLGISLHGIAQTDDEDEMYNFVIFYHCEGLTENDLSKVAEKEEDGVINNFCKNVINEMLSELDQWFYKEEISLEEITIAGSNLIRCSQSDAENIQEKVAKEFKQILSSPDQINKLIEEDGSIDAGIGFDNYNFYSIEEPEQYVNDDKERGEVDSIHVFGSFSDGELKLIYHKGFETVKKLLEAKAEDKNETRNVQPAPPSSTSNGQNQSLSQSPQITNTAHIARILSTYQASSPLRSTSPTSPVQTNNAQVNPRSPSVQTSGVSPSAQEQSEEKVEKENSVTSSFRPR